jgi:2-polyprenyl-3-methyl-5-hydroxy-6-metoxy-1,4-benzoquinol methylase
MFRHKRVAIDFDGTLFEDVNDVNLAYEQNIDLAPLPNADYVTGWLKALDFEILIFTCRPDYHRKYLERHLKQAGISFDYILFYTKPRVDLYIDDKGFRFIDWDSTKSFIEEKLYETDSLEAVNQSPNQIFESALRQERLATFENCISSIPKAVVLDYGCGEGKMQWNSLDGVIVDGFDIDKKLLEQAEETQHYRNVYYEEPSLEDYDAVVLMGVLEHVEDDASFLENLRKVKHIFATVPNAGSFHRLIGLEMGILSAIDELGPHDLAVGHKRYYDKELLANLFEAALGSTHEQLEFGTLSIKFGSNAQMAPFKDVAPKMNTISRNAGLTGDKNFMGAEIYAYWVKND